MSTFRISDGVEIRYEVFGSGPPVFVCHGGPSNICDTLIEELVPMRDVCTLVFHDYRGSGRSGSAPTDSYTVPRLADDLDELRQHLGYESVSVLAHSMGGLVALEFALRHPTAADRVALVGTSPCGRGGPMMIPVLPRVGTASVREGTRRGCVVSRSVELAVTEPGTDQSDVRAHGSDAGSSTRAQRDGRACPPRAARRQRERAHLLKTIGRIDLRPALPSISAPVLVLYGSRDAVMVAGGQMLVAALPNYELRVLDDVGHEPFIEAPVETFACLREFLSQPR